MPAKTEAAADEVSGDVNAADGVNTRTDHGSLKYQLLGPSLTKAGQEKVDQKKVSEIIYNASKGSKFFSHEQARDKILTEKIQRIIAHKAKLEKQDLSSSTRHADEYMANLELHRDLTQNIVHIDCDAFFAAVEELDRPELRDVPMAVGRGVLSTCNYHARKFGCRSGMAGFVAKKLCPQLICIPQNSAKYSAKAKEIRAIIANYDPQYESASVDEAYLNITEYCDSNGIGPQEAVQKLRDEISSQTGITVSAGIASNTKIAKICSNWNKPNGQYYVPNDRVAILNFMAKIPVRKVNGVGRVFERELDAIGIKNCEDIFPLRGMLTQLFGQKAFQFLMHCYLGLGRTQVQPAGTSPRKSVGTERTFRDLTGLSGLQEQLRRTAIELEKDLHKAETRGRTLVLKIKLHTFEVISRQTVLPKPVTLADDLYRCSLPLLLKLHKEIPDMRIRLMGLRCTNLVSTKKTTFNFFNTSNPLQQSAQMGAERDNQEILSAEAEFEEAEAEERLDEIGDLEQLSQEIELARTNEAEGDRRSLDTVKDNEKTEKWYCPICTLAQPTDHTLFNQHVDYCLSRETIKEAVQGTLEMQEPSNASGKRKRPLDSKSISDGNHRPFFFK
ncbi:hypothetical protein FQN57_003521 [Myotisia sp. PD_48]|nr:hypothetical protein FQN57_003521 [Myotisia sp. PD_48]